MISRLEITYEIMRSDYAEANSVVARKSFGRRLWNSAILLIAGALLALPLAYQNANPDSIYPFIVLPFAAYLGCYGLLLMIPTLNALTVYKRTDLAGQSFEVVFTAEEVLVRGRYRSWINKWPAFALINESKNLFVFYDGITVFIFAKRYFSHEQMSVLRQLISQSSSASAAVFGETARI